MNYSITLNHGGHVNRSIQLGEGTKLKGIRLSCNFVCINKYIYFRYLFLYYSCRGGPSALMPRYSLRFPLVPHSTVPEIEVSSSALPSYVCHNFKVECNLQSTRALQSSRYSITTSCISTHRYEDTFTVRFGEKENLSTRIGS